ncbi:MAG TPA: DUF881 domain-containing protein, partial [Verrucomicrobiae bacterium]|nr:DUF881 domain-containing protein [Verrucomicrobiae bacterium]
MKMLRFSKLALPTFLVAIVLGFLMSVQYQVQQRVEKARLANAEKAALSNRIIQEAAEEKDNLLKQQDEVRKQIEYYRNLSGGVNPELTAKIQTVGILNGETPAEGPGIHIEIDDRKVANSYGYNPTDELKRIVNVLKYAGAEGIAVNGQRIGPRTAFTLSGSSNLMMNNVPVARITTGTVWQIEAIGDQAVLKNYVQQLATDGLKL